LSTHLSEDALADLAKRSAREIGLVRLVLVGHPPATVDLNAIVYAVTTDRLRLAEEHLLAAQRALAGRPPQVRSAISRAYYCMYQAVRSVVFEHQRGDFDDHEKLPSKIPDDFPDAHTWRNRLKDARLSRNDADYSPYPRQMASARPEAASLVKDAKTLLAVCREYLTGRGWVET